MVHKPNEAEGENLSLRRRVRRAVNDPSSGRSANRSATGNAIWLSRSQTG